jgi:predicted HD phosphohydrolase
LKVTMAEATVERVMAMLAEAGEHSYGGEAVSQLEHALQAATLAQEQGHDEEFVVACLLHDLGHLTDEAQEVLDADAGTDADGALRERRRSEALEHGAEGAAFLEGVASERMRYLIAGHAAAKRYLCTTDPSYYDRLSPVSKRTMTDQGGLMSPEEVATFAANPWAQDLVALRRFDDEAKEPGMATSPLEAFRPMLERQLGAGQ